MARQHDLGQTWAHIQRILRTSFPESTYNIWLTRLRPATFDDASSTLLVEVTAGSGGFAGGSARRSMKLRRRQIRRSSALSSSVPHRTSDDRDVPPAGADLRPDVAPMTFKPGYVRPVRNRQHEPLRPRPALAAAEMPGHAVYNPLLIHGPRRGQDTPSSRRSATTSLPTTRISLFATQLPRGSPVTSRGLKQSLHSKSSRVPIGATTLLLVDDLQFLEGKRATAEEFRLHTFDSLLTSGRQIVISSDRDPAEISFLEKRDSGKGSREASRSAPDLPIATRVSRSCESSLR